MTDYNWGTGDTNNRPGLRALYVAITKELNNSKIFST
jgi:hypothetical protein